MYKFLMTTTLFWWDGINLLDLYLGVWHLVIMLVNYLS